MHAFALRVLTWHLVSSVFWISGGISGGLGRGIFWTIALTIEMIGAATTYPFPGSAEDSSTAWGHRLAGAPRRAVQPVFHDRPCRGGARSRRCRQLSGLHLRGTTTLVASFVVVVSFWRIYFYHVRSGHASTQSGRGSNCRGGRATACC
ncbi:hypothetical protein NKG94_06030 [Micromonospora sp. M12]